MTRSSHVLPVLLALAAASVLPCPVRAGDLRFNEGEARQVKQEATRAREFSPAVLTLLIPLTDLQAPATETVEIRCAAYAGVQGVRVDLTFRYFAADRSLLGEASARARTDADGWTEPIRVPQLVEGAPDGSLFWAEGQPRGGKKTDEIEIRCVYAPSSFCDGSTAVVCS